MSDKLKRTYQTVKENGINDDAIIEMPKWSFPDDFDASMEPFSLWGGLEQFVVGNTYDVNFHLGEPEYSGKAKLVSKKKDSITGLPIYNFVGVGELKRGE